MHQTSDGSITGRLSVPGSGVRSGGSPNGGVDSYGNFFTYTVKKDKAKIVLEYAPPGRLRQTFGLSDVTTPVLFTDGATTLYTSANGGLDVYESVGRSIAPVRKYSIREHLLQTVGSEGRYTARNGFMFAAPFQAVPGCGSLFAPWTISVYRPRARVPFEKISPPKGSSCFGGGLGLIAADNSANLFVLNDNQQLLYYPFGSEVPTWSKNLIEPVSTMVTVL